MTKTFDKVDLTNIPLFVSEEEFALADSLIPKNVRSALEFAIENVKRFHKSQMEDGLKIIEVIQ